jgi:hypothetical protein
MPRFHRFLVSISVVSLSFLALIFSVSVIALPIGEERLTFNISFPIEVSQEALDGRLLLLISNNGFREPRFQISDGAQTQLVFGAEVEGLAPNQEATIDGSTFGYPLKSLEDLPAGEYWVQALLHRYETFHRADGHVVKLPMDRGEGLQWNRAPGNLFSTPVKLKIDPAKGGVYKISMDRVIEPIPAQRDSKYIKHVKIQSELLSKFWGRPMEIGVAVLLPEGFDEHPDAHYPLVIMQGHFSPTIYGFRETPPDKGATGRSRLGAAEGYRFYQLWTGKDFPRVILAVIQHPCPYYDDSYGVNSANCGPYGDAIIHELIPFIETKFRGIGQGWARGLYGGSTGGWIVLAEQIFYPDEFNGAWASCPDPVDFRAYQVVNIYSHKNAYYLDSDWKLTPRPGARNYLGEVLSTMEEQNHLELVLGTHGRSGDQWDIWQAVFSPVGDDGYPKPIWDKMTGEIDHQVAEYWREHYDLRYILDRDWKTLGPKLKGKLHIYVGDMDTFYLNDAVYLLEAFLESTKDPYYDGEVVYGDRFEHCWSGYPKRFGDPKDQGYNERFIPMIVEHILKTAPEGADLKSWRY